MGDKSISRVSTLLGSTLCGHSGALDSFLDLAAANICLGSIRTHGNTMWYLGVCVQKHFFCFFSGYCKASIRLWRSDFSTGAGSHETSGWATAAIGLGASWSDPLGFDGDMRATNSSGTPKAFANSVSSNMSSSACRSTASPPPSASGCTPS